MDSGHFQVVLLDRKLFFFFSPLFCITHEVKTATEETPKVMSSPVLIPGYLSLILCALDLKAKVNMEAKLPKWVLLVQNLPFSCYASMCPDS